ncbi:MAG: cytochrome c class [Xanthomonadaceae bacterium]|nr:cytochrome c class [Xanthomonadaceae bacterium]
MSSRCRNDAIVAVLASSVLLAGCQRESREYNASPTHAPATAPRLSTLQPGDALTEPVDPVGLHYENNAYHITQGGRLFRWFNCNGCHANGGGSIGPALMDEQWRYGGNIDQIHDSILQGRPNGMPAWKGKVTDQQAWQLSAYVRALSGNVRKDAAPSRREGMAATPPLTQIPKQPPRNQDDSAGTVPPP